VQTVIASVDEGSSEVGLPEYNAVLHHRDIVEQIATQRHGEIGRNRSIHFRC
jgi:hypothetical protein